MSTTFTSPASNSSPAKSTAPKSSVLMTDLAYLTHHLVLLAIVVGLALGGIYFVEGLIQKHDLAQESKYSSLLTQQAQQTQAVEDQLATEKAQWTQTLKILTDQNAQLSKDIVAENAQIAQQQKVDATLNAQQSAARLSQQTGAQSGEVVAQNNGVLMDLPTTHVVMSDLDELIGAQADLVSTKTQLQNETTIATSTQQIVTKQNDVISGLQAQNIDQVKACTAEVAVTKAKVKRAGIKGFFIGVGTVLGVIVAHAAGL